MKRTSYLFGSGLSNNASTACSTLLLFPLNVGPNQRSIIADPRLIVDELYLQKDYGGVSITSSELLNAADGGIRGLRHHLQADSLVGEKHVMLLTILSSW